jgi:hypothetical protein
MDAVAVTVPLDLMCPSCENVGVLMRVELPPRLVRHDHGGIEDAGDVLVADKIDVPTVLSCGTCDRSVSFGPLAATVEEADG